LDMLKLEKKHKYLILSLIITSVVYLYSLEYRFSHALLAVMVTVAGTYLVQFPNNKLKYLLINNLLSVHLIIGVLISLFYFPNLGLPVKIVFILATFIGLYIVSLINNVFLVVEEKKDLIPLYRVAVTWSQIVFVTIAIPFFAGVFKIPTNSIFQNGIVAVSAFLFAVYTIWTLNFDPELKRVRGVEVLLWGALTAFFTFTAAVSVSFFPTESFLRALFVASVLMLGLSYLNNYLKNDITKKNLTEYFLITALFYLLLFIFRN